MLLVARLPLTEVDAEQVRRHLSDFCADPPSVGAAIISAARADDLLPLDWSDWAHAVGMKTTGEVFIFESDGPWPSPDVARTELLLHVALRAGSKHYPELQKYLPARPTDAVTCPLCKGQGRPVNLASNLYCVCGGMGWLSRAAHSAYEGSGYFATRQSEA